MKQNSDSFTRLKTQQEKLQNLAKEMRSTETYRLRKWIPKTGLERDSLTIQKLS